MRNPKSQPSFFKTVVGAERGNRPTDNNPLPFGYHSEYKRGTTGLDGVSKEP